MSRYRKFTTICCAAAFALGLAACGGGDDGLNTSQEQELQEQKTTAEEMVAELQGQIDALRMQLGLGPEEGDPAVSIQELQDEVTRLQGQVDTARLAQEEADRKAAEAAAAAMAATAAKLHAGISAPSGSTTSDDLGTRAATYDGDDIDVRIVMDANGDDTADAPLNATLSEDKDTSVAANHGWTGKRYADPAGGDSYEAVVFSNVEAPKMGKKFGSAAAVATTGDFQYQLIDGALPEAEFDAMHVAFTGVTRTAGTETFRLPTGRPQGETIINLPGSYHGVSGTYNCMPTTPAAGCSAAVAAKGFTVSSDDTWTFVPGDANARVTESADPMYASYGWWLRKAANDGPFTASAFVDDKGGNLAIASGVDDLNGMATYQGGAAGKYALASSTGGTNDAGHFTARATLDADFNDDTITGTIDMFMGADDQPRNWSVKLMKSHIGDDGALSGVAADGSGGAQMTEWTIDGTAAADSGNWSGSLRNNGNDDVPQVATGTFYTEYGTAGRMVGAFGANKQ